MDKLDSRTDICILLGYSHNTKGIKLLSLQDGGRAVTRDIAAGGAEISVPVVEIRSVISTYQEGSGVAQRVVAGTLLEGLNADLTDISAEAVWPMVSTSAIGSRDVCPDGWSVALVSATPQPTKGKKRRKRRRGGVEADSDEEVPRTLRCLTVEPMKVLPRRKRARPSHIRDLCSMW
ncbi:unnamed protein product [Phytophthora fragariaefolia]|uniref:Unnamed protein product n=1 Tax=Phytophthora fragariaefolia TaxID=1490495 RepID=A0A9W6UBN7_9STRA|nr:unnamed protein product [Phytophthora fragariaefolia]